MSKILLSTAIVLVFYLSNANGFGGVVGNTLDRGGKVFEGNVTRPVADEIGRGVGQLYGMDGDRFWCLLGIMATGAAGAECVACEVAVSKAAASGNALAGAGSFACLDFCLGAAAGAQAAQEQC